MTVLTVAAGVIIGWLVLCLLLVIMLAVAGCVASRRRRSCFVCGWRGNRADLLVHEELNHQERSGHHG